MRRAVVLLALAACPGPDAEPPIADGIFAALGEILPTATEDQRSSFLRGRERAEHRFTRAEGLGPHFNTSFCASCHNRPVIGGSAGRYQNFLLVGQRLSDGSNVPTGVNGVQPSLQLEGSPRRPLDEGTNRIATRNPIPFFGTGVIAEIFTESILENADPDDADGDGVSGRPNFDRGFVGRFGRKAQTVSIEGFIRGPLFNHLGITSDPLPDDRKAALPVPSGALAAVEGPGRAGGAGGVGRTGRGQAAAPDEPTEDDDGVPDPELSEDDLFDLVSFSMLLAAPEPDPLDAPAARGLDVFRNFGCDACHVETLLGPRGRVPLYSDLLLHDMGPELADGVEMGVAGPSEFRTQPLWGVVATGPWLHDGRADTLDDAIRWHGGEGSGARDRYAAADAETQADLLAFLSSLGGRREATPGLLPPDEVPPEEGEIGGPRPGIDRDRFAAGRRLFDRNFGLGEGIGPRFNGDSCRACHAEPVVGGAGPVGLNVVRHGRMEGGVFVAPEDGTVAHRLLHRTDARAPVPTGSNVFEMRQPQALFGLGLLERIPEAAIRARADPDDIDGDGIRGRPQILPDGTLGRFGWKADLPNLAEFVGDALAVELGLTVPAEAGLSFGRTEDDDDAPDPEVSMEVVDGLFTYLDGLAPPPRVRTDPAAEDRGAQIFAEVGCNNCHVADWVLPDGTPVPAYTDLLLHEVQPAEASGIPVLEATARAFRTAPLWAVGRTGPWMHDGLAFTLEQAVARHDGEAAASALAVSMRPAADRADLLAFLRSL